MTTNLTIQDNLRAFLQTQQVEVHAPRERMLELKAVPVGEGFSKRCTNLLLWNRGAWRAFVDDDLAVAAGEPHREELLRGPSRQRWRRLTPAEPFSGDVNDVLVTVLDLLDSPLRASIESLLGPVRQAAAEVDETDFELTAEHYAQLLDVKQFDGKSLRPTAAQAAAVERIVLAALREESRVCPVIVGPSGSGKSTAARLAAEQLVRRGAVRHVFAVSGASLHAGVTYEAERDERLCEAFAIASAAADPLIVFEQIDLLLVSSRLVHALLADLIDRGVRLIGVTQGGFDPRRLRGTGPLRRRVELIEVDAADPAEMPQVLQQRLAHWPLAQRLEVLPEAVAAAAALAARESLVEPAGSLGLLEAALVDARQRKLKLVGPDEVYHTFCQIQDGFVTG
jgi:hypothetical protein